MNPVKLIDELYNVKKIDLKENSSSEDLTSEINNKLEIEEWKNHNTTKKFLRNLNERKKDLIKIILDAAINGMSREEIVKATTIKAATISEILNLIETGNILWEKK